MKWNVSDPFTLFCQYFFQLLSKKIQLYLLPIIASILEFPFPYDWWLSCNLIFVTYHHCILHLQNVLVVFLLLSILTFSLLLCLLGEAFLIIMSLFFLYPCLYLGTSIYRFVGSSLFHHLNLHSLQDRAVPLHFILELFYCLCSYLILLYCW